MRLWLVGPFQNRRLLAFWLVSSLSLGCTSAWFTYQEAEKVADAEGPSALPPGPAPSCDVLDIHDGDTMKLDCGWDEAKPQIVIVRLYCIDAPELGQEPWGKLARDHLRNIAGKVVAIEPVEYDKYRRLVVRVHSSGLYLNLQMVADGFAPVYPKYCKDKRYFEIESGARSSGIGIWSMVGAHQEPWLWRHR
jgi:endonuclease YncB( thermonuclease family)